MMIMVITGVSSRQEKVMVLKPLISCLIIFMLFTCIPNSKSQTSSVLHSPPLLEASPESVGLSQERLERVVAMCKESVKNGDVPGIVALVARKGKIVLHEAYGMADNESGRVMKKDDIFRIASQTKAITSTAVMMLWEEGKFRLDDPVSKYIPEFRDPMILKSFTSEDTSYTGIPADKEISIRHLLTHTSGLGYGIGDGDERFKMIYQKAGIIDLFTTKNISIEENIKKLATLPLHHNPGEAYLYGEGLDVLGYFIEVVSGMPFDEYLRTHLFDPLGMDDTWFYLPDSKKDRLVTIQHKENEKWVPYPITFYDPDYPIKGAKQFFSGGAGLSSTAKDYATFLQMYLNGGELNGVRILSRTTVRSIMGNQTGNLFGGDNAYYGLAFSIVTSKGEDAGGLGSEGTFSWGGYFDTQYFADPVEQTIGIVLKQTQGSTDDPNGERFRKLVFQAIDE